MLVGESPPLYGLVGAELSQSLLGRRSKQWRESCGFVRLWGRENVAGRCGGGERGRAGGTQQLVGGDVPSGAAFGAASAPHILGGR